MSGAEHRHEPDDGQTALLRAVGANVACAFAVLRPDATYVACSAGARELLGPATRLEADGAADALAEAFEGQARHGVPLRLPGTDGPTLDADFLPLGDGVLLRLDSCASATEHRCFFQHSRDLLTVADHEGRLLRISPSWTECLGWGPDDLVGRPYLDLVHPDDREGTLEAARRLTEAHDVMHFENRYRCRDGSYRWLQWNAVSPPGHPVYAVARDVTDQRNAMAQLHAAYDALQDAEQRRLRLFQNVAHDLASPLTAMGLHLALLETADRPAVGRLRQVHDHLKRLVGDVRDLSLAESRELRLRREPTPVHDLLGPTLEALREAARARGVALHAHVEDVVLDCDPLRFNQIVYNLVTNAIKFTPEGGRVDVHARRHDSVVRLTVADTGAGLDEGEARRLFQPFVQLHAELVTERGSGLGLFICKQLAEAHDGRIWVESPGRGRGSRFHVDLPAA